MSQPPPPPPPPPSGPEYGGGYGGGYGGSYGPGGGVPYPPAGAARTNGKATAALVTGIGSLVLSWCCGLGVAGIIAVVLGTKARSEIRNSGGSQQGDGFALAGIVTGAIAIVLGLLVLVVIGLALVAGARFESDAPVGGGY